ncbi:hypothetical protein ACFPLB_10525 [Aquamicrobium segne]|uniref:DUF945 domain-containing protein n=1 Tax=Aquamicrobium segne TaxID=469547 RepID=A0ABW0GZU7_9HYPH
MSFQPKNRHRLALSTILFSMALTPAWAQDTGDIAQGLKTALSHQGLEMTWTSISGDASSMSLQGVSLTASGSSENLAIGDVKLEDVMPADGGYTIKTLSTQAYSRSEGDTTIEASPFIMRGVVIPAEDTTNALGNFMYYQAAELDMVSVSVKGTEAFSASGIKTSMSDFKNGQPMNFSASVPQFSSNLALVEDAKFKDAIKTLGYETITGNMTMAGSWNPADGRLDFSQYDISVDNAGTLGMTFSIGGYTPAFIKSMQDLQKQMAQMSGDANSSAQGMAILGLMQQLSFNSAAIRFTDHSLTNKVLDYVGKQQGMSGKDIANQVKAIVPFGLAQLQNPELTTQASTALNQYLDDPRSLEILASPASPMPFALIMANAMGNPADLTKSLGVAVKANQN